MKNSPVKHSILHQKDGRLICPSCGEFLCSQDVESYARCPYCDHKFSLNGEMEDFLLKQVTEHWCRINMNQYQNISDMDQPRYL